PEGSRARKQLPLVRGLLDYFPNALIAVADVSYVSNDKHNPGESLHWSRDKSTDHADSIMRHLIDRGAVDPEDGLLHSAHLAWRALALLEEELEAHGATAGRGSVFPKEKEQSGPDRG
ncbi:MAG: dATP/dGTP diphosphohydrolase domain-containing protein, partial [Pyrinomonadaceae bacterium]